MNKEEPYRIEFPCAYPIKIVGVYHNEFELVVRQLNEKHAPGFSEDDISVRMSSKGNYCSVTITITATGEAQLKRLHQELMGHERVKMVL